MSNVTATATATSEILLKNLPSLLASNDFKNGAKVNEILSAKASINVQTKQTFLDTLALSKQIALSLEFFKSQASKDEMKRCNCKLTIEQFAKMVFNYERSYFYDLAKIGKLEQSTINDFLNSGKEQSVKSLLSTLSVQTDKNTETDGKEESESESEVKVKIEPLQIKVGKDNKISIKGKASKEILTLLIEELKKMMA